MKTFFFYHNIEYIQKFGGLARGRCQAILKTKACFLDRLGLSFPCPYNFLGSVHVLFTSLYRDGKETMVLGYYLTRSIIIPSCDTTSSLVLRNKTGT